MFDKNLFLSLCERYDVELSDTADCPMIRDNGQIHTVTQEDVSRVFAPCKTFFNYSSKTSFTKVPAPKYSFQEGFTIAC